MNPKVKYPYCTLKGNHEGELMNMICLDQYCKKAKLSCVACF